MKINEINTPAILLNLDYMEHNLKKYCGEAKKYGKEIWPMVKTHKSTELARLQAEYGCSGYLCGTLDEAEALAKAGAKHLMYAYPGIDRGVDTTCHRADRADGLYHPNRRS